MYSFLAFGMPMSEAFIVIEFDRRKCVVVNADEFSYSNKLGGAHRVVDAHREEIADGKNGEIQLRRFAHEFHVERERGVAGIIKITVTAFDHEPGRITAVGTIGHRAAVNGAGQFHPPEIHFRRAAVVHRLDILHAFLFEPGADFEGRDYFCAGAVRDLDHVRHVITVTVRDQNKISRDFADVDLLRERVRRNERIE